MVGQIELEDYLKSINRESLNILDYIPTGRMNAITRHALAIRTGISDRQVRDLIHYARKMCIRDRLLGMWHKKIGPRIHFLDFQ